MWRGKSDGDQNKAEGRSGQGQPKGKGNAKPGQKGSERAGSQPSDPRSRSTGKKIRRIESGSSRAGTPASSGPRRRAAGSGPSLATRGQGGQSDPTDIGRPPSGAPARSQQPSSGGRGPSLPPLSQPTGEIPKVPSTVSSDDTVVVSAVPPIGDAFSAQAGSPEPFDDPMPSALDPIDGASAAASNAVSDLASDRAPETVMDATGMMPSLASVATEGSQATVGMANFAAGAPGRPGTDNSLTDPFPEAPTEFATGAAAAAAAGAPRTRSFDAKPMASAGAAAGMVTPTDARSARGGRGQAAGGAPTEVGQPPQRRGPSAGSSRPARGQSADPADRLQDTEFKLADKRRKQKPKEPNRLVLGLALGLVVLVGIAVAYFLTQGDDEATDGVVADQTTDSVVTEAEPLSDAAPAEVEETPAQPEPQVDEPTLFFEAAQTGPLQQGETYSIDLVGEPPGSLLQVVVDDRLQGEPDPQLPDLILPAGRHSLFIQMTNGAEVTQSTPIEVYVLGEQPPKGYRANLSSVDIQTEGWVEAIRQFDEYRAAGHEGLQLSPLSPGYWNIFVGGLGEDSAAVTSYCESFGLEVPVDCFGAYYEPTAAPASPDTTVAESMEETETTDEAMTDASDTATSTTAAGG